MAQSTYKSVVLAQRPKATIVPGETFKIKENPMVSERDIKDGEVLIEALYLSLDPAMRGWLNDARSYVPPVQIGAVMRGEFIGRIVASKAPKTHPVGAFVTAMSGWTELAIAPAKEVKILDVPANGKVTDALGVLGMTGLTAYFGITDVGQVKAGDFVVVSGAAGATGSVVVQIAKLLGARVLAIAGSDDKVAWLKELGADDAINYKKPTFVADFKAATKDLIDVFFDNVGGDQLELALSRAKPHARFVLCGAISQYNDAKPTGPRNISMVIAMRIKLQGFIVFDYAKQYGAARKQLSQWLAEGKLKRKETIVPGGLAAAENALVNLYNGINTGKLMVEVKPVEEAVVSKL
ncbi:putative zinc-binding alcohol dehydrogenase-containing protein 1 [Coleophoma crateriformis]|uniref:Putative zinc-binding alcohol dehydrogenase-containing protein 1 n=1 Tax=Coleophoma crateriformis TaxID=565419 RepID=A0A3D8RI30_9HELO|nr:putative zinc-binding alcohol dehydrogenase-containing protein 1 [Coleophoma crateriformis]